MMQQEPTKSGKQSTLLNGVLAVAIIVVAGALLWVGMSLVDSAQKRADNLKKLNTTPENTKIAINQYEAVPDDVGELMAPDDKKMAAERANYRGSEIPFHRGLDEMEANKFDAAIADMTKVIAMVPQEAKTQKIWHSDGTIQEQAFFTAFTYQARAYCYAQQRQYKLAVADLTQAIKLRPGYPQNYENRAKAYYYLGQKALGDADMQQLRSMSDVAEPHSSLK